jgi:hypothetical protein
MKPAAELASDALIYIPNVMKIGLGVQKFLGGCGDTHTDTTHRQQDDLISLFLFSFFPTTKVG